MQDNPLEPNDSPNSLSLQNVQAPAPTPSVKKNQSSEEEFILKEINPVFESALTQLRQELIVEGYSAKTMKMYLIYMREALYFIDKPIETIVKNDIISYLAHKKEKECNNATLALIHAAMKYFFKKNHMLPVLEEIKIPKKAKTLPKVLTRDEIKRLFESTHFGRNRLMLQFMYGSGCRVSEVAKIKVEDLNMKERIAIVRAGKGNKDRIIVLSKEWIHGIKKYLAKKKIQSEFVFSKKNGKPITTDTIQRIVRNAAVRAQINKHVTPHCLRHSYATHLLEAGTNIRYIQTLLGHSSLNTTQIYTSVANDQLKKVESPLDKL